MKKSKKLILLALSVAVALSLVFTWPAKVSAEDIVLNLWHWETPPHRVEKLDEILAKFREETGIEVRQNPISFPELNSKILAAIAANRLPEMIWVNPPQLMILRKHNSLVPVTDIFKKIDAEVQFLNPSIELYRFDQEQLTIPVYGISWPLEYRADLYEENGLEPPVYWTDLLEAAKKLTKDLDGDGRIDIYGMMMPYSIKGNYGSQAIWGFLRTNRANVVEMENGKEKIVFNSTQTIETYKFLKELTKYTSPGSENMDWGMGELQIRTGKVATAVYTAGFLSTLYRKGLEEMARKWKQKFIPRPKDGRIGHTAYTRGLVFTTTVISSKEREAAVKTFVRWLYKPENYAEMMMMEPVLFVPVVNGKSMMDAFFAKPLIGKFRGAMEVQIDVLNNSSVIGFVNGIKAPHAAELEGSFTLGAVLQKIVLQGWSVERAVEWGQKRYEEIIKE